jgi:hypothetical protein
VDLLDAHSNIKPADFYGRVKATGSRNYGEDVADRNIGENGVDVRSVEAKKFYNKTFGGAAPTSKATVQAKHDTLDDDDDDDDNDDDDGGDDSEGSDGNGGAPFVPPASRF